MEPLEVHGVDAVLHDLEPVARDHRPPDVAERVVGDEQVVAGERRCRGRDRGTRRRSRRARATGYAVVAICASRLSRFAIALMSTHCPAGVERPSVIRDTAAHSRRRIRTARDAPRCGHRASTSPGVPVVVRKSARSSPRTRTGIAATRGQLDRRRDRQPVPAEQLAHRGAATDAGECLGLLGRSRAIAPVDRLRSRRERGVPFAVLGRTEARRLPARRRARRGGPATDRRPIWTIPTSAPARAPAGERRGRSYTRPSPGPVRRRSRRRGVVESGRGLYHRDRPERLLLHDRARAVVGDEQAWVRTTRRGRGAAGAASAAYEPCAIGLRACDHVVDAVTCRRPRSAGPTSVAIVTGIAHHELVDDRGGERARTRSRIGCVDDEPPDAPCTVGRRTRTHRESGSGRRRRDRRRRARWPHCCRRARLAAASRRAPQRTAVARPVAIDPVTAIAPTSGSSTIGPAGLDRRP